MNLIDIQSKIILHFISIKLMESRYTKTELVKIRAVCLGRDDHQVSDSFRQCSAYILVAPARVLAIDGQD